VVEIDGTRQQLDTTDGIINLDTSIVGESVYTIYYELEDYPSVQSDKNSLSLTVFTNCDLSAPEIDDLSYVIGDGQTSLQVWVFESNLCSELQYRV
jgi:hypothetical protein